MTVLKNMTCHDFLGDTSFLEMVTLKRTFINSKSTVEKTYGRITETVTRMKVMNLLLIHSL